MQQGSISRQMIMSQMMITNCPRAAYLRMMMMVSQMMMTARWNAHHTTQGWM